MNQWAVISVLLERLASPLNPPCTTAPHKHPEPKQQARELLTNWCERQTKQQQQREKCRLSDKGVFPRPDPEFLCDKYGAMGTLCRSTKVSVPLNCMCRVVER
ncbi:hypothetical protein WMY93_014408 [Mugilogobius chulae]|uniref:Uncharacterized protein n=1 Tax=Mugilogobius chulae TaxID=88201 RepID=A0AAW0NWV2_9GOBI